MKTLKGKIIIGSLYVLLGSFVAWRILFPHDFTLAGFNQVTLNAAAWDDGSIPIFASLHDGPDVPYRTVPDGTRCTRLDNEWYKLGSGATALYFYKVDCGSTSGYVNRDRARR